MKTKEFIKMLQEEDPTGEGYIRVNGGAIISCESKPGYWDGMYSYFDKKNNTWHTTAKGYKIDINTLSWKDIVWEEDGDMKEIRKILKPDFSSYVKGEEDEKNFWNKVDKEAKIAKKSSQKLSKEMLENCLKRFNNGWIFYKKDDKYASGYWKKGCKKNNAMIGEVLEIIKNEELFIKIEKNKNIQYKLNKKQ